MLRIKDASNFRRTLAGLALVAAPVTFGAADVIRLSVEGGAAEGVEQLRAIADNIGLWNVASVLNMVGVILFVPAILGLMHLLRQRSVTLGHIGGALSLIGVLGWAGHNAGYFGVYGAASTFDIEPARMAQFFDHAATAPGFIMYVIMFLLGFLLGPILLGIGLYRARTAPRRATGLFVLGMAGWIVAAFSPLAENVVAIATVWALISVGLGAIGVSVLSMSDADWEAQHSLTRDSGSHGESPLAQAQAPAS